MFDTVDGLPVHALVVHAVTVLVPRSVLGSPAILAVPRWRRAVRFPASAVARHRAAVFRGAVVAHHHRLVVDPSIPHGVCSGRVLPDPRRDARTTRPRTPAADRTS